MTRFARAKGSKASNERAPEDATPWNVMKEQLQRAKEDAEHAKHREKAEKQRLENYENFLKEQKTAKRKSTWCEFPVDNDWSSAPKSVKKAKKNKQDKTLDNTKELNNTDSVNDIKHSDSEITKNTKINISENSENIKSDLINSMETTGKNKKRKHNKNKNKTENTVTDESPQVVDNIIQNEENIKCKQSQRVTNQAFSEAANDQTNENSTNQDKKKKKNKQKKHQDSESQKVEKKSNSSEFKTQELVVKPKKKKDGNKNRRKPETDYSFQIIINGREVELVRYDGFPVMKKDADRLKQLRQDMMKKGIPKKEVERTMKLERRRAEKALARVKRDVCYNCRKGGHNLSDCPDLRSRIPAIGDTGFEDTIVESGDGICFKCGSTEHRQSECRVQKGQQFRFASCFICKEQGHIARQCPDNPKGLYPNGGACKLCGDVTHLRKDCPTTKTEKEEAAVRLETLDSVENVEDLPAPSTVANATSTKKPKKITF